MTRPCFVAVFGADLIQQQRQLIVAEGIAPDKIRHAFLVCGADDEALLLAAFERDKLVPQGSEAAGSLPQRRRHNHWHGDALPSKAIHHSLDFSLHLLQHAKP